MARQLRSGSGWRVGWDPDAVSFQALLGADDWAVELTQTEFNEFCRFAQQLRTDGRRDDRLRSLQRTALDGGSRVS
jgi:Domain of unknown function (DUF1818)